MPGHANIAGGFLTQKKYAKNSRDDRVQGLDAAKGRLEEARGSLKEYRDYGKQSIDRQNRLFNDPSYLENTGGYKFTLDQGLKGTTAARSRTSIFSGETLKALTEYAAGLAQQTYSQEWDRFQQGINTGMAAEKQYGDLTTTSAEIEAGIGEARARYHDQNAANLAGEIGFGRQIFGQWSSAFASSTASSVGGGGG